MQKLTLEYLDQLKAPRPPWDDNAFPCCEHVEIRIKVSPAPTSGPGWYDPTGKYQEPTEQWEPYPRTPEGWQQWKDAVAPYGGSMPPQEIIEQRSKAWKAYADRQWEDYQCAHKPQHNTES